MRYIRNIDIIKYDYIVIGSGFSGSIVARELAESNKKILILEKRKHFGGNMYDEKMSGILTHKYGPHILHFNQDEIYNWLSKFSDFFIYKHKVYAEIRNEYVPLPFNLFSIDKIFGLNSKYKKELIDIYGYDANITIHDLLNSKNTIIKEIGKFLYSNVFYNYSTKMWGFDPSKLDKFVLSRIPIRTSYDDDHFKTKYQIMPKLGYTKMFEKILSHENIDIRLESNMFDFIYLDEKDNSFYWKINNKKVIQKIIFSGCIDELFNYKFGELKYRSLHFEFINSKKQIYQKYPTINFPSLDKKYTRFTEMKRINMQFEQSNNSIILKEVPGWYEKGSKFFGEQYYPIPTDEQKSKFNQYFEYSKKIKNLFLIGRLALYKYIDMATTIDDALKLSKFLKDN